MALESMSEESLARLCRGPLHMFTLVAAADSVADRMEWDAFREAVGAFAGHDDQLVKAVMTRVLAGLEDTPPPHDDIAGAIAGLREVRAIAESLPGDSSGFRSALLEIGRAVAEASGAQLTRSFGIGGAAPGWQRASGTSAMERESIARAAEALGLD